jgi:hypothetical protein
MPRNNSPALNGQKTPASTLEAKCPRPAGPAGHAARLRTAPTRQVPWVAVGLLPLDRSLIDFLEQLWGGD